MNMLNLQDQWSHLSRKHVPLLLSVNTVTRVSERLNDEQFRWTWWTVNDF